MSEGVLGQLRRLIVDGSSPVEASEIVMTDLPRRWKDWARPFVLRAASGIEGSVVNRTMRRAMGAPGSRHRERAAIRLHETVYRLPDGSRILWDDMTVDMLDLKIAQLRKHIGSLVDHLRILESARKLCADRGVMRLGEIDGWVDLVQASAVVVGAESIAAREPRSSTMPRRRATKDQEDAAAA